MTTLDKGFLERYGITPNRALGQNFLCDANAIEKILAAAKAGGEFVLEIGPGLGALTQGLARRAERVMAVEIDNAMIAPLSEKLAQYENVKILRADFLKASWEEMAPPGGGDFIAAGNLPYYATTPICLKLFEQAGRIRSITVMVQKEAARRFFAGPGDKAYGPLSVIARSWYDAARVMELPPDCFYPQPGVDSTVVRLERAEAVPNIAPQAALTAVTACFAMRRKTIINNLLAAGISRPEALSALQETGVKPEARAESLEPRRLIALAEALKALGMDKSGRAARGIWLFRE